MSIWVLRGLRDGVVTTRWPARPDPYADAWRGPARPLDAAPAPRSHQPRRPLPHRRDHGHRRHRAGRPGPLHPVRPLRGRAPRRLRLVAGRHRPGRAHQGAADHPRTAGDRRGHPGRPGPAGRTDPGAAPQRARPARGRRVRRQRGVGDPGPARPGLRPAPAGRVHHRQPPARRRAAGHRGGRARHDRPAAHHLRRDAGPEGRDRRRHRRGQRRAAGRPRGRHRRRRRHAAGRHLAGQAPRPARSAS